jgi:acyl-CoA thioesterase
VDDAHRLAQRAAEAMFSRDRASQDLGMKILEMGPGRAKLSMRVRGNMLNGHAICHGGFVFSLADSAFAFACNSHNRATVAAGATVDFLAAVREGEELYAEAIEVWRSKRTGVYEVTVTTSAGDKVALFRGRAHEIGGPVVAS